MSATVSHPDKDNPMDEVPEDSKFPGMPARVSVKPGPTVTGNLPLSAVVAAAQISRDIKEDKMNTLSKIQHTLHIHPFFMFKEIMNLFPAYHIILTMITSPDIILLSLTS